MHRAPNLAPVDDVSACSEMTRDRSICTVTSMASPRCPSPGSDNRVRVAVRFGGRSADPSGEVRRLVESWTAEQARGGADSAQDLEQPPRVEMTGEGVDVVFEGRPGNRRWNRWMTSFMRWVSTFSEEMHPVAIVDRTGGEVRPVYVARERPVWRCQDLAVPSGAHLFAAMASWTQAQADRADAIVEVSGPFHPVSEELRQRGVGNRRRPGTGNPLG